MRVYPQWTGEQWFRTDSYACMWPFVLICVSRWLVTLAMAGSACSEVLGSCRWEYAPDRVRGVFPVRSAHPSVQPGRGSAVIHAFIASKPLYGVHCCG